MSPHRGVSASTLLLAIFLLAWPLDAYRNSAVQGPNIPPNDHANFHYFAVQVDTSRDTLALSPNDLKDKAHSLGASLGYHVVGRVGELRDYFLFAARKEKSDSAAPQRRGADAVSEDHVLHARKFAREPSVAWVERQIPKRRLFKRNPVPQVERGRPLRLDELRKDLGIFDPGFNLQWHLVNTVTVGNDLNVTGVWKQGITGHNATVCFVDDGLDYESKDLKDNFYAEGSYDFNDHVKLPKPRLPEDRHGTRCAGEVAAARNDVCGVGVAYDAKVSGVRILSGDLTEADEAAAINYDYQNNHIYSCSWGPSDNGRAMEAPPKIVTDAVLNGIQNGRGGLGSIYVFASGNGGALSDHCNADGYTNSIYTITVGALDRNDGHPVYSEACSAVMIVMYSSSGVNADAIYTTDWPGTCTQTHGGTSAAAPLASGLYALVLQIRPDLSWRDIQHLTVQTAIPVDLDDSGWAKTASGRLYNPKYGFGKLGGYSLVEAAKVFKNVRPQTSIVTEVQQVHKDIPHDGFKVESVVTITDDDKRKANMSQVEHITVTVNIVHRRRGDVEAFLISPNGIVSQLAAVRPYDTDMGGFQNWTFMTVKHWDEDPVGNWTLTVADKLNPEYKGTLNYWWMTLWGETAFPNAELTPPTPSITIVPSSTGIIGPSISVTASPSPSPPQPSSFLPSISTSMSTAAASASATPVLIIGSGGPSVGSYAFGFGAFLLALGSTTFYFRRHRANASSQNYEFKMLNDNEVDAAFEEENESHMRLVGEKNSGQNREVLFSLSLEEEEDEG